MGRWRYFVVLEWVFRTAIIAERMAVTGGRSKLAGHTLKVRYHLRRDAAVASNGDSKLSSCIAIVFFPYVDISFSFPDTDRGQRVEDRDPPSAVYRASRRAS